MELSKLTSNRLFIYRAKAGWYSSLKYNKVYSNYTFNIILVIGESNNGEITDV